MVQIYGPVFACQVLECGHLRAVPGCCGVGLWMFESLVCLYQKAFPISQLIHNNVSSDRQVSWCVFLPL